MRRNELTHFEPPTTPLTGLMNTLGIGVRRGEGTGRRPATATPVTAPVTDPKRKETAMETAQASQTQQGANVPSFESLLQVATELGQQAGQGADTQIKFDLKVIEGAYLGALSLDKDKHGKDRRDGIVLAEAYTKARQGAVVFDAKADKNRKLISNVDKCIKLGSNPKWGMGEPLQTVNTLVTFRQTQRKNPAEAKKLDDAHNMLMRFATAQLKRDTLIDGAELQAFAYKVDPDEVTVEQVLEGIRKKATNLQTGKIAHCNGVDQSNEVQKIVDLCTKRLKDIAKARGGQAATA